ncbi:hypothetical protein SeLEV6574_g03131 [Synchytrium endobioticum]|uniref:Trafficking protein particle complex subunit 6B n=1 Tax=Synchytrium endobioticum TaxID=286115 RepID=A0A507D5D0_9FUNG|nr:hypothetical protein SeLEV6574_g03131 [Synchytrium endobioticum]
MASAASQQSTSSATLTPSVATSDNMSASISNASSQHSWLPQQRFVAESCLNFLLMEMTEALSRSTPSEPVENNTTSNDKEAVYFKLESVGYRVGLAMAERFTKDRPRFTDNLDAVKFICKDFWIAIFKKQVDNLKTNHRGVYVLSDNNFRWFARMSTDGNAAEASMQAFSHLAFPCGLIRGALANLGVVSVVIAEVTTIPQLTFQIKIAK